MSLLGETEDWIARSLTNKMNNKGQMKTQQMAFVLVAIMIFFSMVALFYPPPPPPPLENAVNALSESQSVESVRKIFGTPEFAWVSDCPNCIDLDKVLALKYRANTSYNGFWKDVPYLKVERVYPKFGNIECNKGNYPDCDTISIIEGASGFTSHDAFVALCRYDQSTEGKRCELGKVSMGFKTA